MANPTLWIGKILSCFEQQGIFLLITWLKKFHLYSSFPNYSISPPSSLSLFLKWIRLIFSHKCFSKFSACHLGAVILSFYWDQQFCYSVVFVSWWKLNFRVFLDFSSMLHEILKQSSQRTFLSSLFFRIEAMGRPSWSNAISCGYSAGLDRLSAKTKNHSWGGTKITIFL